jgi:hypothetical protein
MVTATVLKRMSAPVKGRAIKKMCAAGEEEDENSSLFDVSSSSDEEEEQQDDSLVVKPMVDDEEDEGPTLFLPDDAILVPESSATAGAIVPYGGEQLLLEDADHDGTDSSEPQFVTLAQFQALETKFHELQKSMIQKETYLKAENHALKGQVIQLHGKLDLLLAEDEAK